MGLPVVTVVSGGLPIVESTVGGTPVTEAANGRGLPVTKVVGKPGLPVVFETIGVGAPVTYAALNGTPSHTTLSNGNLTATHADTFGNAGPRSASVKTMGKYYFEAVYGAIPDNGDGIGIMQNASAFSDPIALGTNSSLAFGTGLIYSNDINQVGGGIGAFTTGSKLAAAIDFDNARCWFRRDGGIWNNSGTANPATNTGGFILKTPGVGYVPFIGFTANGVGHQATFNFGSTAFVYLVPAGFTSGWPA